MAQPDSHLPAGSLLHYLLTLTHNECRRLFSSAISYRHRQLPFSEVERPALPGLSSRTCMMPAADRGTVFIKPDIDNGRCGMIRAYCRQRLSTCKDNVNRAQYKINGHETAFLFFWQKIHPL